MLKRLCSLLVFVLAACDHAGRPCPRAMSDDMVYVVGRDWHAEIGIPADELDNDMSYYRDAFPGARVIMFGYGKKTFFTAPVQTFSEYLLGPFPGPAVIHAVGLRVTPPEAYPPKDVITFTLPQGGQEALSAFIWNDLEKNAADKPRIVARSSHPDGMFYAAKSGYNLMHTCNSWTAEALHAAGLPVSVGGVSFSGQVMSRGEEAAARCPALLGRH